MFICNTRRSDCRSPPLAGSTAVKGVNTLGLADLLRWGADGFAFRSYSGSSTDQVVLLRSDLTYTTSGGTPTLTNLAPSSLSMGSPNTQITVIGTGFVPGALVLWNGLALETSYISSTQLIALIPSNQLASSASAQVTAVNPAPGGSSSALTFTVISLPAPSLTLASIPDHTFGDQPFNVSATSNSNGAITYSVQSGPASISGSTVTITGAGTVVIAATQVATVAVSPLPVTPRPIQT